MNIVNHHAAILTRLQRKKGANIILYDEPRSTHRSAGCASSAAHLVLLVGALPGFITAPLTGQVGEDLLHYVGMAVAHADVQWVLPSLGVGGRSGGLRRTQHGRPSDVPSR